MNEEIRKILNMGIIQRSSSPYINPIVPVIKKDGTVRLCLGQKIERDSAGRLGVPRTRRGTVSKM